ncbi:MAG: hypothetical protein J2P28_25370 [Actinobacteria bacterium]|nr:hypothetical protein [Actinomycetota bacterium]MBO0838826.1 hypothetical protein [Actinomycetota bacterium]
MQPPRRYILLATGFCVLAIAGIAMGVGAAAHHIGWLDHLAVVVGLSLGLVIGMLAAAYNSGVRGPSYAQQMTDMVQTMQAGQAVSGRFAAGLRELVPSSSPLTNWKSGRVVITPQSVTWTRTMTGRPRDLAGAQVTGERRIDGLTEMTLTLPNIYRGENVCVLQLRANGTDLEIAAPVKLLEVLRYSLARTTVRAA